MSVQGRIRARRACFPQRSHGPSSGQKMAQQPIITAQLINPLGSALYTNTNLSLLPNVLKKAIL